MDTRSDLTKLNQTRWAKVGHLTSTAALLKALLKSYPTLNLRDGIPKAIEDIEREIRILNVLYCSERNAILRKRKELSDDFVK